MSEHLRKHRDRPIVRGLLASTALFIATTFVYKLMDRDSTNSAIGGRKGAIERIDSAGTTFSTTGTTILDFSEIVFEELPATTTTFEPIIHETASTIVSEHSATAQESEVTIHQPVQVESAPLSTTAHTIHVSEVFEVSENTVVHAPQIEHNVSTSVHSTTSHEPVTTIPTVSVGHSVHIPETTLLSMPDTSTAVHPAHEVTTTTTIPIQAVPTTETVVTDTVVVATIETVPASIAPPTILIPIPES